MILEAAVAIGCVAVEGERVLASDMAKAVPAFAALAPETPLGFAPAPGARRIFGARELDRLGARFGIRANAQRGACFERVTERLTQARVAEALVAALEKRGVRIEVIDFARYPVPRGELRFPAAPASVPPPARDPLPLVFRGRVVYGKRSMPVWAKVRVTLPGKRALALADLPAGKPVGEGQVEIVDAGLCPFSEATVESKDEVVGLIPRRSIPRGTPVFTSLLEKPKQVERGETVTVEVSSGRAGLRLEARAESGGNTGDTITVRNLDTGRRFSARVGGKGKVIVDARKAGAPPPVPGRAGSR